MYKVMLIDDEKSIRKLLQMTIAWEEYDMEVVGEAASGIEALNTIDEIQPDICFVDIRMPFMDGIEFSKLAIKRYPGLKINILTAHDEFEYARECIGIGVSNYFLKPIVKAEINSALSKLKLSMDKERSRETGKIESGNPEDDSDISHIKKYIKANYTDYDLNLTKVAQEFGFNSSYLSRKFKAETGQSFVDYIGTYRVEQAKVLALEGKPMYQVASAVGIPDPNYFGKCFKKYTEMSFSDYVSQNLRLCKNTEQV